MNIFLQILPWWGGWLTSTIDNNIYFQTWLIIKQVVDNIFTTDFISNYFMLLIIVINLWLIFFFFYKLLNK